MIELSRRDHLEASYSIFELDICSRSPGELLGHEEWLGEEALDLPCSGDGELVLFRELIHSEDGDDVLQFLVSLEDLLDVAGSVVMILSHDLRDEDGGSRIERVDRGIDSELRDRSCEDDG